MAGNRYAGRGALIGFFLATGYSLIASVVVAVSAESVEERYGFSFISLINTYLLAGIVSGAAVGFLWPWARKRLGAAILGIVGVTPFSIGASVLLANPVQDHDLGTSLTAGVIFALVFGIWAGLSFLHRPSQPRSCE